MNVHSKDDRCDVSMAPNEEPMMRPGDHFPVNLRPVLEDVPWDNEDEMPSVSTTCYIDRDSIRLPLHLPYTSADVSNWNALQKQSVHRLYAQHADRGQKPELVRPPAESLDTSKPRRAPHDMIGWSFLSPHDEKKMALDGQHTLTQYKSSLAAWNQPWAFKDALGADSNAHVAGNTLVGSRIHKGAFRVPWHRKLAVFLLRNPFVPLLLRLINIAVLTSTLAVGVRLRRQLIQHDIESSVGISPLTAIIFAPLSLAYALFQIWLEYKSRPIGLWKASSKLWYMTLELVFVCLWSAELALSFDNYFTSTIGCIKSSSPFYSHAYQDTNANISDKSPFCNLQTSLICLNFISVMVYLVVFLVRYSMATYTGVIISYILPCHAAVVASPVVAAFVNRAFSLDTRCCQSACTSS